MWTEGLFAEAGKVARGEIGEYIVGTVRNLGFVLRWKAYQRALNIGVT